MENYTKMPNKLLEFIIGNKLTACEMACLLFIVGKTLGWNKEQDKISVSQFRRAMCFSSRNIMRALEKLSERKIIEIEKKEGVCNIYKLVTATSLVTSMSPVTSASTTSDTSVMGTSDIPDTQLVTPMSHTKEHITKNNLRTSIQKKETALFSEDSFSYQTAHELKKNIEDRQGALRKQPDMQRWAKHIDLLIRVDQRKEHEVIALIEWLFHSEGRNAVFWRTNILSTESLRHKWDKLVAAMVADVHVHKQETKVWSDL